LDYQQLIFQNPLAPKTPSSHAFYYLNLSQNETNVPGLSKLELNYDFEEFISIVPAYWENLPTTYDWDYDNQVLPDDGDINIFHWYAADGGDDDGVSGLTIGENNYGLNNYLEYKPSHWSSLVSDYVWGLDPIFYQTYVTFNEGDSTQLELKWKHRIWDDSAYHEDTTYTVRFGIKKSGNGSYPDYYLSEDDEGEVELTLDTYDKVFEVDANESSEGSRIIEFSKTIELNPIKDDCDTNERLIFFFYPLRINDRDNVRFVWRQMIGDFEIRMKSDNPNNQQIFTINTGFVNKDNRDINIFDIDSYNYRNGIYLNNSGKTNSDDGWTDDGGSNYEPLIDHFIKGDAGYGYKNRKQLSFNGLFKEFTFIKPLSIIKDDYIPDRSFIIDEYSYNISNGNYNINCNEYSTDKKNIIIE